MSGYYRGNEKFKKAKLTKNKTNLKFIKNKQKFSRIKKIKNKLKRNKMGSPKFQQNRFM